MQILLIEDDALIARELQLHWRSAGWGVECCANLTAANTSWLQATAGRGFDLVVLDLGLPDGDGMQWLRGVRRTDRQTPILVLTARDRVSDKVAGLKAGADDYLVKPFDVDELEARVTALTRRSQRNRHEVIQFDHLEWIENEGLALVDGKPLSLSPREFQLLGLLMRRAPRVVAKRHLAEALAESNLDINDSAVELYVSRLRRRLLGSGFGIRTARGFGYRLVTEAAGLLEHEH